MPTYDYKCQNCGNAQEIFQRMSDDHINKCPSCGSSEFKRLIGRGSGPIFKGTGFYETDYKKSNSGANKKSA